MELNNEHGKKDVNLSEEIPDNNEETTNFCRNKVPKTDVNLESISMEDPEIFFTAHKFALASVSPVFKTHFYGSIPEGDVVVIKDSNIEAFKHMLDYVYQNSDREGVDQIDDVFDLLDIFYLADKYEVLGLKEKILKRFRTLSVDASNYEDILLALEKFAHFEDACDVLQSRVLNLISRHNNPLDLVEGAIDSNNDSIKEKVLVSLFKVGKILILESVKAAHDIIRSKKCKLDEKNSLKSVMRACVEGYEEVMQSPHKLSKFIPEPTSHLQEAHSLLQQFWKNNFCDNCDSSACLRDEIVDIQSVKVGARVVIVDNDSSDEGVVTEVGLVCGTQNTICKILLDTGELMECSQEDLNLDLFFNCE